MALAGVDHLTIPAHLLTQLAETPRPETEEEINHRFPSLLDQSRPSATSSSSRGIDDDSYNRLSHNHFDHTYFNDAVKEADWRIHFTRRDRGAQEIKLVKAINIFCDMQEKLELLLQEYCHS